jgi:hypothetical protein
MTHDDLRRRAGRVWREGRRRAARLWRIILPVAATTLLAWPQDVRAASPPATVEDVCRSVVQLKRGGQHFDGCTASLAKTMEAQAELARQQEGRRLCSDRGLERGTAAFAVCAVQALDMAPADAAVSATRSPVPASRRSWFSASFDERLRRIRLACARLGLDPAYAAFDGCVLDLQLSLSSVDQPQ